MGQRSVSHHYLLRPSYSALPPRSANDNGGTPAGVQGAEPLAGGATIPIPLIPIPLSPS